MEYNRETFKVILEGENELRAVDAVNLFTKEALVFDTKNWQKYTEILINTGFYDVDKKPIYENDILDFGNYGQVDNDTEICTFTTDKSSLKGQVYSHRNGWKIHWLNTSAIGDRFLYQQAHNCIPFNKEVWENHVNTLQSGKIIANSKIKDK